MNNKKVIIEHVISAILDTVWFVLMIVAILVFVAEDKTGTAILVGVGAMACIGMIINEVAGIINWLNIMEMDNAIVITKSEETNK